MAIRVRISPRTPLVDLGSRRAGVKPEVSTTPHQDIQFIRHRPTRRRRLPSHTLLHPERELIQPLDRVRRHRNLQPFPRTHITNKTFADDVWTWLRPDPTADCHSRPHRRWDRASRPPRFKRRTPQAYDPAIYRSMDSDHITLRVSIAGLRRSRFARCSFTHLHRTRVCNGTSTHPDREAPPGKGPSSSQHSTYLVPLARPRSRSPSRQKPTRVRVHTPQKQQHMSVSPTSATSASHLRAHSGPVGAPGRKPPLPRNRPTKSTTTPTTTSRHQPDYNYNDYFPRTRTSLTPHYDFRYHVPDVHCAPILIQHQFLRLNRKITTTHRRLHLRKLRKLCINDIYAPMTPLKWIPEDQFYLHDHGRKALYSALMMQEFPTSLTTMTWQPVLRNFLYIRVASIGITEIGLQQDVSRALTRKDVHTLADSSPHSAETLSTWSA